VRITRCANGCGPISRFPIPDNPPTAQNNDPIGEEPVAAHSVGGEVGLKVQNESGTISGSLALYHTSAKNETFFVTSTLAFQINPSGLNGRFGGSPSTIINVDRKSDGVQLAVTANPNKNLRLRLSAAAIRGEIGNTVTYKALYNDQFYANAAGQVTYRNGAVVYVLPTFSAARPTVPEGTAGAIPLTIAALSTPGIPITRIRSRSAGRSTPPRPAPRSRS